jgi:hypothetical protein
MQARIFIEQYLLAVFIFIEQYLLNAEEFQAAYICLA